MFGIQGKMMAQVGKRSEFIEILKEAADLAGSLEACRIYIVSEDLEDENAIRVFEVWDTSEAHNESLQDERVQALITKAIPLMAGAPEGVPLEVAGGYGL